MNMKTEAKHTPTPWSYVEGKTKLLHIETANLGDGTPCGMPVCSIPKARQADADLIVQAVNAHDALVGLLREVLEQEDEQGFITLDLGARIAAALKLAKAVR